MPRPYPKGFREDVIAVARRREGGVTLAQVAKDFGISESCLTNWTCRVLKMARQPYYRWCDQPVTDAEWTAAHRANALFDAHLDDLEFGHRLLADEARAVGQPMADWTAWRICSDNGWWSVFGKPKAYAKARKAGAPAHDDIVHRDFTATGPNLLWLTDITEHWTDEGKPATRSTAG